MKFTNCTGIHSIMLYFCVFHKFFFTLCIPSSGCLWGF